MLLMQASELLYFSTKYNAEEAYSSGLVSAVFPHDKFEELAWARVNAMTELPVKVPLTKILNYVNPKLLNCILQNTCIGNVFNFVISVAHIFKRTSSWTRT